MRTLTILSASALAAAALSAPAGAKSPDGWQGSSFHNGGGDSRRDGDRRDMRNRGHGGGLFIEYDAGAWAAYNNRGWDPNSYNDWWHDRPDRAFPRWVQQNQNCTPDRMWWSGSGWHC